jgi:hypothetical protein
MMLGIDLPVAEDDPEVELDTRRQPRRQRVVGAAAGLNRQMRARARDSERGSAGVGGAGEQLAEFREASGCPAGLKARKV